MKETRSFSLLELIITLGILAVISTMLLDNFADVKARQCGTVTRQRGEQIKDVILGEDGHDGIGGFLSDMGRLPNIYIPSEGDGDGGRRLAELYDGSIWHVGDVDSALNHVETLDSNDVERIVTSPANDSFPSTGTKVFYPEISMSVGWRGPYLSHATPVKGKLYDGWGRGWKIISNYNLNVSSNHVRENWTAASHIELWGTEDKKITASSHKPISGLISFGGNDTDDRGMSEVEAANEDQQFLFPHHQDNLGQGIAATLEVELQVRNEETGKWQSLPAIAPWSSGNSFVKGDIVAEGGSMYWCKTAHKVIAGATFSDTNWIKLNEAKEFGHHGSEKVYRKQGHYHVIDGSETIDLGPCEHYPDSISLILAVPVMSGTYSASADTRVMRLGYYHFFRNLTKDNEFGVEPVYWNGSEEIADLDCQGDTKAPTAVTRPDYNNRYLIAEDQSKGGWNEYLIKRLMPGNRRLFCITYNKDSEVSMRSEVENMELRSGSNRVKLYLRSR